MALIPITLLIASCENDDIKMAEEFGQTSATLSAANTKISADIYDSCTRRALLFGNNNFKSREQMKEALKVCDELYKPNAIRTKLAGGVLIGYVKAIGELATDDRAGFNQRFTAIEQSLNNLQFQKDTQDETGNPTTITVGLEANAVNAGIRIADFISNLIVLDFRRENLKPAIVCTSKPIQDYSEQLAEFVNSYYVDYTLNQEIDKLTEVRGFEKAEDKLLKQEIQAITNLKKEGSAYVTALESTGKFHNRLKFIFNNGQDELSTEQEIECDKYLNPDIKEARYPNDKKETYNSSSSSVLHHKISFYELKQVNVALEEYINEVTPLLAQINKKSE